MQLQLFIQMLSGAANEERRNVVLGKIRAQLFYNRIFKTQFDVAGRPDFPIT